MTRQRVEAIIDPFFNSALFYLMRQQKCKTKAETVRRAIVIAAKAKDWKGPKYSDDYLVREIDERWMDREERSIL
jgi:hypothetical protein